MCCYLLKPLKRLKLLLKLDLKIPATFAPVRSTRLNEFCDTLLKCALETLAISC